MLPLLKMPQSVPAPARQQRECTIHGNRLSTAHQICMLLSACFHHFFITPPCRLLCHVVAARLTRDASASRASVRSMSEAAEVCVSQSGIRGRPMSCLGALCCYVARSVAITVPDDGGVGSERHYPASLWTVGATRRS